MEEVQHLGEGHKSTSWQKSRKSQKTENMDRKRRSPVDSSLDREMKRIKSATS